MATLKDYLISGKFTGDISVNGFHMSLKDMLISAKLSGGGGPAPEEKKYLVCQTDPENNFQTNFITLPFNRNQSPKVVMEFFTSPKNNSKYRYIINWGDVSQTRSFLMSTSHELQLYRGSWTYVNVDYGEKSSLIGAVINYANKTVSITKADGTVVTKDDSGGTWNSGNQAFKIPLCSEASALTDNGCIYQHRVTAYDVSDNLICDCIAGLDGNGVACMVDHVSGNYYYDDLGEAYLVTLE